MINIITNPSITSTWDNPYARILQAMDEDLARSMADVYELIAKSIPGIRSIKIINNDEGGFSLQYKTDVSPFKDKNEGFDTDKWYTVESTHEDVDYQLWDIQGGIDMKHPYMLAYYAKTDASTLSVDSGKYMSIDKSNGEVAFIELDLDRMANTYTREFKDKTNTDLSDISLVYVDQQGKRYYQPLVDVPEVGTLVDPKSEDDLKLLGWVFTNREG